MKQTLKYIYQVMMDIQKYSESKHSITLTLSSAVVVFSATFLSSRSIFVITLTTTSIILALVAILYSFFALSAKDVVINKTQHNSKRGGNLLYFRDVYQYNVQDYVNDIIAKYNFPKSYKPDEFDYDLAKQIISTAKVVERKFRYFNYSIYLMISSIAFLALTIAIVGGIYA